MFKKETLEQFPVLKMKLLHKNLIQISNSLYELYESLYIENTDYNDEVKDNNTSFETICRNDIEEILKRINNICSVLSYYTLSNNGEK